MLWHDRAKTQPRFTLLSLPSQPALSCAVKCGSQDLTVSHLRNSSTLSISKNHHITMIYQFCPILKYAIHSTQWCKNNYSYFTLRSGNLQRQSLFLFCITLIIDLPTYPLWKEAQIINAVNKYVTFLCQLKCYVNKPETYCQAKWNDWYWGFYLGLLIVTQVSLLLIQRVME